MTQFLFWLSGISGLVSSLTLFHRFTPLPYWAAALLAVIIGSAFGLFSFYYLDWLADLRVGYEHDSRAVFDWFFVYIQLVLLAVFMTPALFTARRHRGHPIPTVPDWLLYLPCAIALLMAMVAIWAQVAKRRRTT